MSQLVSLSLSLQGQTVLITQCHLTALHRCLMLALLAVLVTRSQILLTSAVAAAVVVTLGSARQTLLLPLLLLAHALPATTERKAGLQAFSNLAIETETGSKSGLNC